MKVNYGGSSATGNKEGASGLKFTQNPESKTQGAVEKVNYGGSSATGNSAETGVPIRASGNENLSQGRKATDTSNKKGIPLWKANFKSE